MPVQKGYHQVMSETETEKIFTVEGSGLLVVTGVQGMWSLALVAPDNTEIPLKTFSANLEQSFNAPAQTRLKLSGSPAGAKAWVGLTLTDTAGLLL